MILTYDERLLKKIAYDYGYGNNSISQIDGFKDSVSSSFGDIWAGSGDLTYPTSATVVTASSSSASDTSAGIGARTILIQGLDSNYDRLEETITLNGTTAVTSTKSFLRINSANIVTSGSSLTNVGDITLTINGNTQGIIKAAIGQTQKSHFTVPRGFSNYCLTWELFTSSNAEIEVRYMIKLPNESWRVRKTTFVTTHSITSSMLGMIAPEKSEIRVQAKSLNAQNKPLSVDYQSVLLRDHV